MNKNIINIPMGTIKIEKGKHYLMYDFYNLGLPDLRKVKIEDIVKMDDNRIVVRYSTYPMFFKIHYDMFYDEFIKCIRT